MENRHHGGNKKQAKLVEIFDQNPRECLKTLNRGDKIYKKMKRDLTKHFRSGEYRIKVKGVDMVHNSFLKAMFELKKAEYQSRYGKCNERLLFHSTKGNSAVSIMKNNFDWRRVTRGKFGFGTSFSPDASYADYHSNWNNGNKRAMIITKVLVAKTEIGKGKCIPSQGRDTSIDHKGKVFVKYDDNAFLPQYVVYYERCTNEDYLYSDSSNDDDEEEEYYYEDDEEDEYYNYDSYYSVEYCGSAYASGYKANKTSSARSSGIKAKQTSSTHTSGMYLNRASSSHTSGGYQNQTSSARTSGERANNAFSAHNSGSNPNQTARAHPPNINVANLTSNTISSGIRPHLASSTSSSGIRAIHQASSTHTSDVYPYQASTQSHHLRHNSGPYSNETSYSANPFGTIPNRTSSANTYGTYPYRATSTYPYSGYQNPTSSARPSGVNANRESRDSRGWCACL